MMIIECVLWLLLLLLSSCERDVTAVMRLIVRTINYVITAHDACVAAVVAATGRTYCTDVGRRLSAFGRQ